MENQKIGDFMPPYLKEALIKAREQKAQDTNNTATAQAQAPNVDNKDNESPTTDLTPNTETAELSNTPATEPNLYSKADKDLPHSDKADTEKAENDVNAWKGRLKKEQIERQKLNERLIAEAEARQRAEARLRELEAEKNASQTTASSTKTDPSNQTLQGLSADELEDLRLFNPELYQRISQVQQTVQTTSTAPIHTPAQPSQTATQTVNQSSAAPTMTERDRIWYAEIQREIPEIQGLLGNQDFIEFAQSKTDWTGATALDLIQQAGFTKDVQRIPTIRTLLDEYQQQKTQSPATTTVPPQKTATAKSKAKTPKQMTDRDEAHAEMLARLGKTKELREFLAQFKQQ